MNVIYVGVGEYAISGTPGEIVKTLALGSCVAVVVLDADNKSVGLLHIARICSWTWIPALLWL